MARFKGTTGNPHDGASRVGVLLVNHGSPDGTDVKSVRRYLKTFLSDRRLIELPRLLWFMLLHGIILRVRPRRTAKNYAKIWTENGSPMQVISERLVQQVRQRCEQQWGKQVIVAGGNLYGNPSVAAGLEELRAAAAQRIVIVPLYPQYTGVTVGSVFDQVAAELTTWRWVPELRFVSGYHDEPEYLQAMANSIRAFWEAHGRGEKLVLSYHSLPVAYVDAGDPYYCVCRKTSRKIAAMLGLKDDEWMMSFQSAFGAGEWLKPDLEELMPELHAQGLRKVDVVCPGFSVDNLETLEEIVERYVPDFAALSEAADMRFISCLNDSVEHVDVITAVVKGNLHGWEEVLLPVGAVPNVPESLERARVGG